MKQVNVARVCASLYFYNIYIIQKSCEKSETVAFLWAIWYRYKCSLRDCYSFYPSFMASVLVKSLFSDGGTISYYRIVCLLLTREFSQVIILIDWEVGKTYVQEVK